MLTHKSVNNRSLSLQINRLLEFFLFTIKYYII